MSERKTPEVAHCVGVYQRYRCYRKERNAIVGGRKILYNYIVGQLLDLVGIFGEGFDDSLTAL